MTRKDPGSEQRARRRAQHQAAEARRLKTAYALLQLAAAAIDLELFMMGREEWLQSPVMVRKERLLDRIKKFLSVDPGEQS